MADLQFPGAETSPWTDAYGQVWIHNGVAWVREALPRGVPEAPVDTQQYSRKDAGWVLTSADEWYLGSFTVHPSLDNYMLPLRPGLTYYNTEDLQMYVWDGTAWDGFSGVSEIATLAEFRWDTIIITASPSPTETNILKVSEGDENGNFPVDDWIEGQIILSLYLNGRRLIERRSTDGTNQGDWTQPLIGGVFPDQRPDGSQVMIYDYWVIRKNTHYIICKNHQDKQIML